MDFGNIADYNTVITVKCYRMIGWDIRKTFPLSVKHWPVWKYLIIKILRVTYSCKVTKIAGEYELNYDSFEVVPCINLTKYDGKKLC